MYRSKQAPSTIVRRCLGSCLVGRAPGCEQPAVSGFTSIRERTPPTVSFDALFYPTWVSAGVLPTGLGRSESRVDHALAWQTAQLEQTVADFETREVETWGKIMDTLELWP